MKKEDFIKIAEYGNINWKGFFSEEEIKENADIYWFEFEWAKKNHSTCDVINSLLSLLDEDNTDESINWATQIRRELDLKIPKRASNCKNNISDSEFSIESPIVRSVTKKELHELIERTFPEEYCGNIATITEVGGFGKEKRQTIVFGKNLEI